jgi:hypothetical protein
MGVRGQSSLVLPFFIAQIYTDIFPFFLVRWGSKCLLDEKLTLVP